jgi:hypothetical protein
MGLFNRKEFLKVTGLASVAGAGFLTGCSRGDSNSPEGDNSAPFQLTRNQTFNMSGYAAPALDEVRIGIVGIGSRGSGAVRRLSRIEGTRIAALCDLVPENVESAITGLEGTQHSPEAYTDGEEDWKRMCEREDLDLIYICTPWRLHTPQAVYAMEHDKHTATELPAAVTIEECWQLVETSERTRKHCMMLGNVCYDFFEMITLNMVRQGFFGELIHGEGAYIHDLMGHNFNKSGYHDMWRLKENATRNGNIYPPHSIGPVSKAMNINCGDKMDYLVSMSSNDFMMADRARELAEEDEFFEPFEDSDFRGNMNTTMIKTRKGRTIMLQHDVTSPRPYSRIHLLSGTKGIARKWPLPARIATSHHGWLSDEEFAELEEEYTPEITKQVGEMARQVGGHGGMDTIMDWKMIDCLRNGLPLDMDVYDAALWSAIGPLSEWSTNNTFEKLEVPDFTSGSWETNQPGMDINIEHGGTTGIL